MTLVLVLTETEWSGCTTTLTPYGPAPSKYPCSGKANPRSPARKDMAIPDSPRGSARTVRISPGASTDATGTEKQRRKPGPHAACSATG